MKDSNLSSLQARHQPLSQIKLPVNILLAESDPVISSSNSWKANIAASRADSHLFFPDNKKWRVLYYHHYLLPISVAAAGSRSSCEECAWHERHGNIWGEYAIFPLWVKGCSCAIFLLSFPQQVRMSGHLQKATVPFFYSFHHRNYRQENHKKLSSDFLLWWENETSF